MSFNRSFKNNPNIPDRTSPNLQTTKYDSLTNRSSTPPLSTSNTRLSSLQEQENEKFFNEDDKRFHRVVFERCADPPERKFITHREKFVQVLSYVGYDLPKAQIDELWSKNDREITFKKFQRILYEEKPIDERTLEEAFDTLYNKDRKNDWNVVDFNRFRMDILEKGDRFTEDEFEKLRYLVGTEGGKVDVRKLTKMIGENKTNCRQKILIEKKEQLREEIERPSSRSNSPKPNSNNNVHIRINPASKKLFIPPKTRSLQMKGAFFCEYTDSRTDALYFSIGYSFQVKQNTPIWITIEPTISRYHSGSSFKNLDIRLFLFEKIPRSTERHLLSISSGRSGSKSYLQLDELQKGLYEIIPVTFGGVLRAQSRELDDRAPIKKLREVQRGNRFTMSDHYRDALEYIFDVFDLDDNKQLDRQEYNLWTIRTTGEEITNDDWLSIREHVHLDVDENISKEKFLKLNNFEVQSPDTTEKSLWQGLKTLGFNSALELDMMCPFTLTVHINDSDVHLKPTSYVELAEIKKFLIRFLKNKGEKIKFNNPSIQCFNYQDEYGSILFVENRSPYNVQLSVKVTNSKNATLNLPIDIRKPPVINIRQDGTRIIWFAHKLDSQQAMELDANIEIQ